MPTVLLQGGAWSPLSGQRLPHEVERFSPIHISPQPPLSLGDPQDQTGQLQGNYNSPHVASPNLVPLPSQTIGMPTADASASALSSISGCRSRSSSRSPKTPSQSLVTPWLEGPEITCPNEVQNTLLHSCRTTTHTYYLHKWKRFDACCQQKQISVISASLPLILAYWTKKMGLSMSSVRVHLSAITAFHNKVDELSIFAHPLTKRFLRGLSNFYPEVRKPIPPWDLNLVLRIFHLNPW